MPVDSSGFKKKVARMRAQLLGKGIEALVQDAATFLQEKIVDEIINGPAGSVYPKSGYPSGVAKGQSGYVGVNTGQLKASIAVDKQTFTKYLVSPDPGRAAVGDYFEEVAKWAERKYGQNYMQIAVTLWGDFIKAKMSTTVRELVRAINKGRIYNYQNPF